MARPHVAALVHDAWNRRVERRLRGRGWGTRIIAHEGYGSTLFVRVLGRVVMDRTGGRERVAYGIPPGSPADGMPREPAADHLTVLPPESLQDRDLHNRWWRDFMGTPAMSVPVRIHLPDRVVDAHTDDNGIIDVTVRGHGLAAGRHTLRLSTPDGADADAPVLIIGTTQRFGIVSDIDDTVLSTSLPRPLVAGWNTFVRQEGARRAVPGMATLYRELRARYPDVPVIYLSTGAWNLAPNLRRFLRRHGYPLGPMLLTDWGPTNTGWFRSGQQHKRSSLFRLAREFPHLEWLLIGDDGQHDPKLYAEFAAARPHAVRAIAIRQLTTGEQVLAHGLPVANEDLDPVPTAHLPMPVVRAPDGYGLARALRPILGLGLGPVPPMAEVGDEGSGDADEFDEDEAVDGVLGGGDVDGDEFEEDDDA